MWSAVGRSHRNTLSQEWSEHGSQLWRKRPFLVFHHVLLLNFKTIQFCCLSSEVLHLASSLCGVAELRLPACLPASLPFVRVILSLDMFQNTYRFISASRFIDLHFSFAGNFLLLGNFLGQLFTWREHLDKREPRLERVPVNAKYKRERDFSL